MSKRGSPPDREAAVEPPPARATPHAESALATRSAEPSKSWYRLELRDLVGVVAILASIVTFVFAYHAQNSQNEAQKKQNDRVLAEELRSQYARITSLQDRTQRSVLANRELDDALAVASTVLRGLGDQATGADLDFIAGAYAAVGRYELAAPLYRQAIARLAEPANLVVALRGLAWVEIQLGHLTRSRATLGRALRVSAYSSYPQVVRIAYDASTERVWVGVEKAANQCDEVLRHARRYLDLTKRLPHGWREGRRWWIRLRRLSVRAYSAGAIPTKRGNSGELGSESSSPLACPQPPARSRLDVAPPAR
jgi:tetratricopeptide (TPR) repeat protein